MELTHGHKLVDNAGTIQGTNQWAVFPVGFDPDPHLFIHSLLNSLTDCAQAMNPVDGARDSQAL
ncbi:hypothetical protein [Sphingobium sp. CR28]|uniref:hypothetical protein n=1 Tax=Sphingobium sp. CR28 TaxID=3400272 RepID=UPI003FEFAE11